MIARRSSPAIVGSRGCDTVARLTAAQAQTLSDDGMDFVVRYLGSQNLSAEIDQLLDADLAVMLVTTGGWRSPPQDTVANAKAAGAPTGATLFLDFESTSSTAYMPSQVIPEINAWANAVRQAGFDPGLYVGPGALLTSQELYALAVDRYWKAASRLVDRLGNVQEPTCGWSMIQLYPPDRVIGGVNVDLDVVQEDFRGRTPNWITRA